MHHKKCTGHISAHNWEKQLEKFPKIFSEFSEISIQPSLFACMFFKPKVFWNGYMVD